MKGKQGMHFLSLCLAVLLTACEGAAPALDASKVSSNGEAKEATVDSLAIKAKQAILAYPALTDANCEEFLLKWAAERTEHRFELTTSKGDMLLETFDDVPLHSANFHYKVARKYYAPSEFVRIVSDFVVQGGNSEDTRAQELRWLIGKHTLPAEFQSDHMHFHGALAMGRTYTGNPEKRSASYDFYLVVGREVTRAELARLEREKGFKYTEAQKARYVREGGTPHLDFEHTVFGQLTAGFDALKALSLEPTDASDWPLRRQEFRLKVLSDGPAVADDFVN